jgi:hypothetical protein
MYFYQAQWWDEGNQFDELRSTREEAIADLASMGCPVEKLKVLTYIYPFLIGNL